MATSSSSRKPSSPAKATVQSDPGLADQFGRLGRSVLDTTQQAVSALGERSHRAIGQAQTLAVRAKDRTAAGAHRVKATAQSHPGSTVTAAVAAGVLLAWWWRRRRG